MNLFEDSELLISCQHSFKILRCYLEVHPLKEMSFVSESECMPKIPLHGFPLMNEEDKDAPSSLLCPKEAKRQTGTLARKSLSRATLAITAKKGRPRFNNRETTCCWALDFSCC